MKRLESFPLPKCVPVIDGLKSAMAEEMLTIFLITHNRPKQAMLAISSILAQSNKRFRLIISDNSDNNELGELIASTDLLVNYLKRPANLSAFEHFNLCISEAKTKYFMLFHDDDLMLPNFVKSFWNAQKQYPSAVAFGGNASIERNGFTAGLSFKAKNHYKIFNSAADLVKRYFSRHQLGIAPFPSYVYLKQKSGVLTFGVDSGKYGDVQFLLEVAQHGQVIWINDPVMVYRLHESNDSNTESIRDRLKFLGFMKRNVQFLDAMAIVNYRRFLYKKCISIVYKHSAKKRSNVMKQYLTYSQYNPIFIKENLAALIKKGYVKLQIFLNFPYRNSNDLR